MHTEAAQRRLEMLAEEVHTSRLTEQLMISSIQRGAFAQVLLSMLSRAGLFVVTREEYDAINQRHILQKDTGHGK